MAETRNLCTKCGVEPRRPGQQWCRSCAAAYMRGFRRLHKARLILQCNREGGRIALETVQKRFAAMGLRELNGVTAAEIVRTTVVDYSTFAVQRANQVYSEAGRKAQAQFKMQKALREAR